MRLYLAKSFLIILLGTILFSCSNGLKEPIKTNDFRKYVSKFKLIKLPYKFSTNEFDSSQLIPLDESDSLFHNNLPAFYGGLLEDTTDYFYVITFLPGDDFIPFLIIYDKTGLTLDSQTILARGCSGGPCINYCSSTSIINKDLSLFSIDSSLVTTCDSSDNEIKGTDSLYCEFFNGQINEKGKIVLEKTQKSITKFIAK